MPDWESLPQSGGSFHPRQEEYMRKACLLMSMARHRRPQWRIHPEGHSVYTEKCLELQIFARFARFARSALTLPRPGVYRRCHGQQLFALRAELDSGSEFRVPSSGLAARSEFGTENLRRWSSRQ